MANVTFSSPVMARDVTVYAVAGDRGTILSLAKAHNIPIPFDCQDGECGSCLVEVTHLSPQTKYAIALTEKEKEALRQLGKISPEEIRNAEVNDMPPRHRLACQCFVRNEDILVTFEGDQVLPAKGPHLTPAAQTFKGRLKIDSVDQFLAYALSVEEEAATHFEQLGKAMEERGNQEVAKLFRQLSGYSRLHYEQTKARVGSRDVSQFMPSRLMWPDYATPERTELWAGDSAVTHLDALKAALQGERRGYEFYYTVAGSASDPEVVAMAKVFVGEEAEHVKILEAWIAREDWLLKTHDVAS
jgi:ferredoxin/rubrerythrin